MFMLDRVEYPVEFANYQRNSNVFLDTQAQGKLAWAKNFGEEYANMTLLPSAVLISGDQIGVQSSENLFVYKADSRFHYMVPIGYNTPVIFGNNAIAYIVPAFLLTYQDYAGKLLLEMGEFPSLREWAYVLLFLPGKDDFLAAVQFTGGPRPLNLPENFDIYRKRIEKSRVLWRYAEDGTIDRAMLTTNKRTMVIIQRQKVSLLETVNISVESSFDIDFNEIGAASLDIANNLVVIGRGQKRRGLRSVLSVITLSGTIIWDYELRNPQTHQPPACGNSGQVYVADAGYVKSISNGLLKWKHPLKSNDKAWMTITKNDSVVLLCGNQLSVIDEHGVERFSTQVTTDQEHFDAPVALDAQGRIYVASDKKLYCYE